MDGLRPRESPNWAQHDRGLDYLKKLRENSNWGQPEDRALLEGDPDIERAFRLYDRGHHTGWRQPYVDPNDEMAIWNLVYEYFKGQIGIHEEEIFRYPEEESYVRHRQKARDRDTQHLEWCRKILMSLSNQPGSMPTSRLERDSILDKLVASEPGLMYRILRSGTRIRTAPHGYNSMSLER